MNAANRSNTPTETLQRISYALMRRRSWFWFTAADVRALTVDRAIEIIYTWYQKAQAERQLNKWTITDLKNTLEVVREEREIWLTLAYMDDLTNLPNRLYFKHLINSQFSEDAPYVAIVMDLDNFKTINTELGHDGGDAAIVHFWSLFQRIIDVHNTLYPDNQIIGARLSGDEFAMGLHGDTQMAVKIANDLQRTLKANPFYSKQKKSNYPYTVTIGIAWNDEVNRYPIVVEQKSWNDEDQILLCFAQAMKLSDMSVELNPRGSISICSGVVDPIVLSQAIKDSIERIKDHFRSVRNDSDMTIAAEKIISEFAHWQWIRWHIRMMEAIITVMEGKHEISHDTYPTISNILKEMEKFKDLLWTLKIALPIDSDEIVS